MRYTRGVFQSLGASGSLLAAGACALLAVSATVGYRGWPGLHRDDRGARALVVFAPAASKPRRQTAGRASRATAAAPRRVLAATEPDARRAPAPRRGAVSSDTVSAPARTPKPKPTSAPASAPSPSAPAARVTDGVAQDVRDTGKTVAGTVAPVSPTAAQTVTSATDTVAGVVDKAGGALTP